jgi:hypothetical protein
MASNNDPAPATQTGAAAGINANIRTIGGAVGAAVVSTILGSNSSALGVPTEAGYRIAFATLAAAALASLIACLVVQTALTPADPAFEYETAEQEAAESLDRASPI